MLQVLRRGLKEIVVVEVPEATVGVGEIKIRTAYSLISSGTEVAGLHTEPLAKEMIRERDKMIRLLGRVITEQGVKKTAQAVADIFKGLSIRAY